MELATDQLLAVVPLLEPLDVGVDVVEVVDDVDDDLSRQEGDEDSLRRDGEE